MRHGANIIKNLIWRRSTSRWMISKEKIMFRGCSVLRGSSLTRHCATIATATRRGLPHIGGLCGLQGSGIRHRHTLHPEADGVHRTRTCKDAVEGRSDGLPDRANRACSSFRSKMFNISQLGNLLPKYEK